MPAAHIQNEAPAWSAPVRACLAGEDLDWLGGRSCCVALDLPTVVSVGTGQPAYAPYLGAVWSAVAGDGGRKVPPALRVHTAAPIGSGLSTSTSLIVALTRACAHLRHARALAPAALAQAAYEVEFEFDRGGGMDQLTIVNGGVLLTRGAQEGLPGILGHTRWPSEFGLVVISSRQPKSTHDHIRRVRQQLAAGDDNLAAYMVAADRAALDVWRGVTDCDLELVARSVNAAHTAMRDLQSMSTPLLEELRDTAIDVGFAGAKVTGAGGGGALVAIVGAVAAPALVRDLRGAYRVHDHDVTVVEVDPVRTGWYHGD